MDFSRKELNLKYLFYSLVYIITLYFLVASNAMIGQPSHENEPWQYLYLFCLVSLLLIPVSSILLVLKSRFKGLDYKHRLQKILNISLIIMVALVFLAELSLTPRANIRIDLIVVIPALFLHILNYLVFTFHFKNITKEI